MDLIAEDTPRRYVVRTYGCQMNEHDSERIAGLLEADGYVAASSEDDADVVVLNTCCIRENADNKLYGNLGQLKTWKGERDGRQIVVSGCLAQKDRDRVRSKASYVDVVLGTHNVHRAADLVRHARAWRTRSAARCTLWVPSTTSTYDALERTRSRSFWARQPDTTIWRPSRSPFHVFSCPRLP